MAVRFSVLIFKNYPDIYNFDSETEKYVSGIDGRQYELPGFAALERTVEVWKFTRTLTYYSFLYFPDFKPFCF